MIKRVMICVMCMMILSACDNNSSGVTVNSVSGESYRPIDLTNIEETTTGMIITGAIEHNTGDIDAYWIRADRGIDAYRNIEVETRNGYLLRLTHSILLTEGTHPINMTLDTETLVDNQIAGGLLYLWSPDEAKQFTKNPQGTLTIRYDDIEVYGVYSLTVENLAGEQVNIAGQFYSEESASAVE